MEAAERARVKRIEMNCKFAVPNVTNYFLQNWFNVDKFVRREALNSFREGT